jgi:MvaI/BcnI restriction endonuclease family
MQQQGINDLSTLVRIMRDRGCTKILAKELAENDNSKNQVYFGPGFQVLNYFPNLTPVPATSGSHSRSIFKAALDLEWLQPDGSACPAPNAQIIFYPQYPEVRFSGFLKGCQNAPSELMRIRQRGRLLFLGLRPDGKIFAYVVGPDSTLLQELADRRGVSELGVFLNISFNEQQDNRTILLNELRRIYQKGWIDSKRLDAQGGVITYKAQNGGGYTLEAELGIIPNGISEPDFLGWELKQHRVTNFSNPDTGVITLMTPEPKGGFYKEEGVIEFVTKYGYPAEIADRWNFGGTHRVGQRHEKTGLKLVLLGYNSDTNKITDAHGAINLIDQCGNIAASWNFAELMNHWNRKHNQAAYIPALKRTKPAAQYWFGNLIRLCEGTDFLLLLKSLQQGHVYYDPGIKVEHLSTHPHTKRRNQFRIHSRNIPSLYSKFETVNILD